MTHSNIDPQRQPVDLVAFATSYQVQIEGNAESFRQLADILTRGTGPIHVSLRVPDQDPHPYSEFLRSLIIHRDCQELFAKRENEVVHFGGRNSQLLTLAESIYCLAESQDDDVTPHFHLDPAPDRGDSCEVIFSLINSNSS